jgi:hypothetical protein
MTPDYLRRRTSRLLDATARTEIRVGRWSAPAFQFCGVTGLLVAIVQSAVLVMRLNLSLLVLLGITAIAVATFFLVIIVTKIVTGEEAIIYYHHELAVLAATGVFVWAIGHPVFPYLAITLLGIGLFLSFGRIGCFLVGCCHGRPSRWGVRYRSDHAGAGFTSCYVGVRLFPIQLIEAMLVFTTVVTGSMQLFMGQPPGWILSWYTILYGWGRFCLEFLRGDGDRPYYLGFSQAQWISAVLIGALPWIASHGALPLERWQTWAAATLPAAMLAIAVRRQVRRSSLHTLLAAVHVQEICAALREVVHDRRPPFDRADVARTSLGLQLSGDVLRRPGYRFFHYAISSPRCPLSEHGVSVMARLIVVMRHPNRTSHEVIPGSHGVVHIIVAVPRMARETEMLPTPSSVARASSR